VWKRQGNNRRAMGPLRLGKTSEIIQSSLPSILPSKPRSTVPHLHIPQTPPSPCPTTSRIVTLGFRGANFHFFKEQFRGSPWAAALEGKGAQELWLTFWHHFFQVQDWHIPKSKKSSKNGRRPAWVSKVLMDELQGKRKVYEPLLRAMI